MNGGSAPRRAARLAAQAVGLALLLGGALIAVAVSSGDPLSYLDLRVLTKAADLWQQGISPYGVGLVDGLQFNYPPSALVLLSPVALLPVQVAGPVLVAVGGAALLLVARWSLPGRPLAALVLAGALALSEPVMTTWLYGQVNLVVLLLVCTGLLRSAPGPGGVALGAAAGLKLQPLAFLLIPVAARARRPAAISLGVLALLLLVAAARAPGVVGDWLQQVAEGVVVVRPQDAGRNESVRGLLDALVPAVAEPLWWAAVLVGGAAVVAGTLAAVRAGRVLVATAIVALGVLLCSPVSWTHHWVWVPVIIGAAVARTGSRGLDRAAAVLSGLLATATLLWLPAWNVSADRSLAVDGGAWVVSYSYVLLGTAALAVLVAREVRTARAVRAPGVPDAPPTS